MKKNDDVPFEVTPGVVDDAPVQVVEDDIPVAIPTDDVADTETTDESASTYRRSAWKVLSSEDLPAVSLREILGGDYLIGSFLRHNIGFILTLVVLSIFYISNRYGAQQEILEEANLRKELQEKKNYAQTQYAQLTMQTRQSALERRLKLLGDSTLLSVKEPPFIILRKE